MNKNVKNMLYENIMRKVSASIKKALNEGAFYDSIEYDEDGEFVGDFTLYDTCGFDMNNPDKKLTVDDAIKIMRRNFPFDFSEAFALRRWLDDTKDNAYLFWNEMVAPDLVCESWFAVLDGDRIEYLHFGDVHSGDTVIAWGDDSIVSDYLGYYMSANEMDPYGIQCPSGCADPDQIERYKEEYDEMYGK